MIFRSFLIVSNIKYKKRIGEFFMADIREMILSNDYLDFIIPVYTGYEQDYNDNNSCSGDVCQLLWQEKRAYHL